MTLRTEQLEISVLAGFVPVTPSIVASETESVRATKARMLSGPFETKTAAAPPATSKPRKGDLEQKQLGVRFEIKADSLNEEARSFSGLASTWDLDLGGDVIRRGAFKRTLKNWKSSKQPMPLLDSHNAWSTVNAVVGKMEAAEETDAGLECTFSVIEGPIGDEVWRRIKGGYVTGLSIGYRARKIEEASEQDRLAGVWRYLLEVELREVSVVLYPMNPGAQIDPGSMKAMSAAIAALEEAAESRELTAEEKAELTELQTKINLLLEDDEVEPDPKATTPAPTVETDPAAKAELAPDDPKRIELDRKLTDTRLRSHGTRVRGFRA